MIIEQKQDYITITSDENSFDEFLTNFKNSYSEIENSNVFLSLSEKINTKEEDIFVFLDYSKKHSEKKTTFIVISNNVDVDKFPETFNIVPTLQEAEDILEMENIQRDLGF